MLNQRMAACVWGGVLTLGAPAGVWALGGADGQVAAGASAPSQPAPAAAGSGPASGEPVAAGAEAKDAALPAKGSDWRANLTAWIWIIGMDGTLGVRDVKTDVNASFGDILEASDSIFAFSGRLEVGAGAIGGFFDGVYSRVGVDDVAGPVGLGDINVTNEIVLIDFGMTYRVGTWEPKGGAAKNAHDLTLDLYAGARYTNIDLELDPALVAKRSESESWFDPIVGAKLVLPISEGWHLALNGDIGGFGVSSDFTWSTTGVFGYDFHMFGAPTTVYAGYRAIGQDYTDENGADRFIWDMVQHGPIVGLTLRF
jgi:hypothetical protein